MTNFHGFKKLTTSLRGVLLGTFAAAISALMVAVPANAEAIEGPNVPLATVVENPGPAGETVTSNGTTSEPDEPTPEPVETEEVASAVPPPSPPVKRILEAPAPNNGPGATTAALQAPIARAAQHPSALTDSAPTAGVGMPPDINVPGAGIDHVTAVVAAPTHRAAELAEEIHRDPVDAVARTAEPATDLVARATDRLSAWLPEADLALQPTDLVNSTTPAPAEAMPSTGTLQADGEPRGDWAISFSELPGSDSLSNRGAIGLEPFVSAYLVERGSLEIASIKISTAGDGEKVKVLSSETSPDGALAGSTVNHLDGPTPSNLPLPAPGSPATAAAGSAGPTFVPIVALLALLALVAPAAMRRLGRARDFRAPTPFVCALERPG